VVRFAADPHDGHAATRGGQHDNDKRRDHMRHAALALLLSGSLAATAGPPAMAYGQAVLGRSGEEIPTLTGGKLDPGTYGDEVPTADGGKNDPGGFGGAVPTADGGRNLPGGYGD
jgi:hypothetical protein